jgi:integrase
LASDDFETLKASIAKTRGAVALGNEIQRVRVVFKYAHDAGLIKEPMRYGPMFKRPSRRVMRLQRSKQPPKMFEAEDVQTLLDNATPQLKAMILLAVNCGFGNNDCATLPMRAMDLDAAWIDFPRPKTGIHRRCPLWPETVKAMQGVLAHRRQPKDKDHAGLVFITAALGSYAKQTTDNPIAKEFAKLVQANGLKQHGRGFYSLRHTFRTIADGTRDQPAVDSIMGHADESMAARYRERIDDARLRAVADYVHAWLYAKPMAGQGRAKPASAKPTGRKSHERADDRPRRKSASAEAPLLRIVG